MVVHHQTSPASDSLRSSYSSTSLSSNLVGSPEEKETLAFFRSPRRFSLKGRKSQIEAIVTPRGETALSTDSISRNSKRSLFHKKGDKRKSLSSRSSRSSRRGDITGVEREAQEKDQEGKWKPIQARRRFSVNPQHKPPGQVTSLTSLNQGNQNEFFGSPPLCHSTLDRSPERSDNSSPLKFRTLRRTSVSHSTRTGPGTSFFSSSAHRIRGASANPRTQGLSAASPIPNRRASICEGDQLPSPPDLENSMIEQCKRDGAGGVEGSWKPGISKSPRIAQKKREIDNEEIIGEGDEKNEQGDPGKGKGKAILSVSDGIPKKFGLKKGESGIVQSNRHSPVSVTFLPSPTSPPGQHRSARSGSEKKSTSTPLSLNSKPTPSSSRGASGRSLRKSKNTSRAEDIDEKLTRGKEEGGGGSQPVFSDFKKGSEILLASERVRVTGEERVRIGKKSPAFRK